MSLTLVPIPNFRDAKAFIRAWHRHLEPPQGLKFAVGAATSDGVLVAVAVAGRPIARAYQDGRTLEVTRVAADGTRNACSMLYAACWRAAKALGYCRVITYTEEGETGASLRAAGYRVIAERPPHNGWDRPSRPRDDGERCPHCGHGRTSGVQRTLWEAA